MKPSRTTIILLLACAALMVLANMGCVTQKACNEKFPPQVIRKDSIVYKETIVYRDTTAKVKGEGVKLSNIPVTVDDNGKAQLPKTKAASKSGRVNVEAEIKDGKLNVDCKEDSLFDVIVKLKEKISTIEKNHSEVQVKKEYTEHWYDIVCRWVAVVTVILAGIYITIKLKA